MIISKFNVKFVKEYNCVMLSMFFPNYALKPVYIILTSNKQENKLWQLYSCNNFRNNAECLTIKMSFHVLLHLYRNDGSLSCETLVVCIN